MQSTSKERSSFVSTTKTLILKMWYLLLGELMTFLVIECKSLQIERDRLLEDKAQMAAIVENSMKLVERSNTSNLTCLATLTKIKEKMQWIQWEMDYTAPRPPLRRRAPVIESASVSGELDEIKQN